jgi:O-antigen/teichoic acid export membrane protein
MSKSILSTAALYTLGSIFTQAFTFATQVILMRSLSLHDYGFYGLSFEVLVLLQMVVGGAFRNYYLQALKRDNANVNYLTYYQIANGSLYILIFSFILYFVYGVEFIISFSLTLSTMLSSLALPLQTKMLADNQRMILILKDTITAIISLFTIFLTVRLLHLPILYVVVSQLVPAVVISFIFMWLYQRELFTVWDKKIFVKYAKFKYESVLVTFMLVFFVNSLHNKLGVIYFKHFSTLAVLAIYLAAFKFINPVLFIQSSLISAYMPKFVNETNIRFDLKIYLTFFIPGLVVSTFLFFFFPFIIQILKLNLYDNAYPLLKVGCWFLLIVFVYGPMSNYVAVSGGQKFILVANCLAFIVYLSLIFILRTKLLGGQIALGVVYSFIMAECLTGILYFWYLVRKKTYVSSLFFISMIVIAVLVNIVFFHSLNNIS